MTDRRRRRFLALAALACLVWLVPVQAADPEDACFAACYVMEVGCQELGGFMYGGCTYNPYLAADSRCHLPGCYCSSSVDGYCGELLMEGG